MTDSSSGATPGGVENASLAFNVQPTTSTYYCSQVTCNLGTCATVLNLLSCASSAATPATTANNLAIYWYCQNKALQQLAKDTFDSFNNGVTLVCGP
jgi:hypothetical protein